MGDQRHPRVVVGDRKIDLQVSLRPDSHPPDDDVELSRQQCRDDPRPFCRDEFRLNPHLLREPVGDIDFETDEISRLVLHGPRDEGGHSHPEHAALHDLLQHALRGCRGALGDPLPRGEQGETRHQQDSDP